jgi:hypothetical protein
MPTCLAHGAASKDVASSTMHFSIREYIRSSFSMPDLNSLPLHSGETSVTIGTEDVRRYYFATHGLSKFPPLMVGSAIFSDFVLPRAESIIASKWAVVFNPRILFYQSRVSAEPGDWAPASERSDSASTRKARALKVWRLQLRLPYSPPSSL